MTWSDLFGGSWQHAVVALVAGGALAAFAGTLLGVVMMWIVERAAPPEDEDSPWAE